MERKFEDNINTNIYNIYGCKKDIKIEHKLMFTEWKAEHRPCREQGFEWAHGHSKGGQARNTQLEEKSCCRRRSFITTNVQIDAWRLGGTKCTKEREFLIQFNIPVLVQSYYRYYCRAGLFVSKCGWSLQISPLEVWQSSVQEDPKEGALVTKFTNKNSFYGIPFPVVMI